MHEFHAWIGLGESAFAPDEGHLEEKLDRLRDLVADKEWHDAVFAVHALNGGYFFTATGLINRQRDEGERLNLFLATIARRLPGSYGLIYERDDEMPAPYGPSSFRVRVLARGKITEQPDPFLSPCDPVIEDNTEYLDVF